ncbi:MAG: DUF86 domain-containing protein [Thermoflexales bacterium]|nr:DUF86 domain-containing protein [Thermoflexales bacterium]
MMNDRLYLIHMLECITWIESYTRDGYAAFAESHQIQDAVIRNFEIMGEAVKRLSPEVRDAHPGIPWRQVAGFRDVLIHDYFGIDLDEVWGVVQTNLPQLKQQIEVILQTLDAW